MEELYRRHVSTRGVARPDQEIGIEVGLSSTFHEASLDLVVHSENQTVLAASGEMTRAPHDEHCIATGASVERLVGVNLGAGVGRAVREAVGGPAGCKRWEELTMTAALALRQCLASRMPPEEDGDQVRAHMAARVAEGSLPLCRRIAAFHANSFLDHHRPYGWRPRARELYRSYWTSYVWLTDPETLRVQSSLSDSWHYPWVELEVDLPSRLVIRATGAFERPPFGPICASTADRLHSLVGQMAWPGDSRAVRQAVGPGDGCSRFEELANEAYRAVYQAHYALVLREHRDDPTGAREALCRSLKGSCRPYSESESAPAWNQQAARVGAGKNPN